MVYCLVLEESTELQQARNKLDALLAEQNPPDPATWGKLPHQQAAMQAAQNA